MESPGIRGEGESGRRENLIAHSSWLALGAGILAGTRDAIADLFGLAASPNFYTFLTLSRVYCRLEE